MRHLLTEQKEEIIKVLRFFFENEYSRFADIPFPDWVKPHIFKFARSIYKRGQALNTQTQLNSEFTFLKKDQLLKLFADYDTRSSFFIYDKGFLKQQPAMAPFTEQFKHFIYTPHESSKNIDTVIKIMEEIPDTTKEIVALGGGITLDISAFIASLLQIKIRMVPTTLLSTIDACLGGKNGVNFSPYGKNQVGTFYNIQHQYIVPEFFSSLPSLEIYNGLVEAIKHLWLWGEFESYANEIMQVLNTPHKIDFLCNPTFLNLNFTIKRYVVNQDPYETKDIRACLNLGHTIAHVIEGLCEQGNIEFVSHGIAVAHGLRFLFRESLLFCPSQTMLLAIEKICRVQKIKLISPLKKQDIEQLLIHDKKNSTSPERTCRFSLPPYGYLKQSLPLESLLQSFLASEMSVKILNYLSFTELLPSESSHLLPI